MQKKNAPFSILENMHVKNKRDELGKKRDELGKEGEEQPDFYLMVVRA